MSEAVDCTAVMSHSINLAIPYSLSSINSGDRERCPAFVSKLGDPALMKYKDRALTLKYVTLNIQSTIAT